MGHSVRGLGDDNVSFRGGRFVAKARLQDKLLLLAVAGARVVLKGVYVKALTWVT